MATKSAQKKPASTAKKNNNHAVKNGKVYDCVTCGACCYNPDENTEIGYIDYIDIDPFDPIMKQPELVRRLVVLDDNLEPHMRLSHLGRCAALSGQLGKKVGCTIYHHRPDSCRRFSAGSKRCQQYRKERGIDP
jgi:Fe-S-cluster containining protein